MLRASESPRAHQSQCRGWLRHINISQCMRTWKACPSATRVMSSSRPLARRVFSPPSNVVVCEGDSKWTVLRGRSWRPHSRTLVMFSARDLKLWGHLWMAVRYPASINKHAFIYVDFSYRPLQGHDWCPCLSTSSEGMSNFAPTACKFYKIPGIASWVPILCWEQDLLILWWWWFRNSLLDYTVHLNWLNWKLSVLRDVNYMTSHMNCREVLKSHIL